MGLGEHLSGIWGVLDWGWGTKSARKLEYSIQIFITKKGFLDLINKNTRGKADCLCFLRDKTTGLQTPENPTRVQGLPKKLIV